MVPSERFQSIPPTRDAGRECVHGYCADASVELEPEHRGVGFPELRKLKMKW